MNLLSPINHDQADDEGGERRKQGTARLHGVPLSVKGQCGPSASTTFTAAEESAQFQYTPDGKGAADMYALAEAYIENYPSIRGALRHRRSVECWLTDHACGPARAERLVFVTR